MLTTDVENYPGFADGILGPELMDQMEKQAAWFGAEILSVHVTKVHLSERPFRVWAGDQEWRAKTAIVATGAAARWLGVPGEEKLRGRGVSACATCDGFFFRDRELVVVGVATAMEEATFRPGSRRRSPSCTGARNSAPRRSWRLASPIRKIDASGTRRWRSILGDGAVTGVRLQDTRTGELRKFRTDGVRRDGHTPNTEHLRDWLALDPDGYIVVDELLDDHVGTRRVRGRRRHRSRLSSGGHRGRAGMQPRRC